MRTISKGAMILAGVHFVLTTGPAVALAQQRAAPTQGASTAGSDVIDLKNGGILRGTIIDAIPNGHARIQLATGEIATVPWQEIAHITRGAAAPAAGPAPSAAAEGPAVWVHIEGSDGAQLQRDPTGNHRDWISVCSAPCDKAVSPKFEYRIAGDGIRSSRPFSLSAHDGGRETIAVDEGSKSGFVLGIVGASVGGVVMIVGLFVVLVNATARLVDTSTGTSSSGDKNGENLGWGISAVGLGGIIGGIVLLASNARSGVTQSSTGSLAGLPTTSPWTPVPAFRDALRESLPKGTLPPTVGVPLFGASF